MNHEFIHTKPTTYSTVDSVEVFEPRGPWTTKSGSELMVLCALPIAIAQGFFEYNQNELDKMPEGFDIRGFRIYANRVMPMGHTGGGEFHRIRQEIIIGLEGETAFECEDLEGVKKTFTLTRHRGIKFDPFIMHSYIVKAGNSGVIVINNTLFIPEDPRTHDTYSRKTFTKLQNQ